MLLPTHRFQFPPPFIWHNGNVSFIDRNAQIHAINIHGDIVGVESGKATLWSGNNVTQLDGIGDDQCSEAFDINDLGEIVGSSKERYRGKTKAQHAFYWTSDTVHFLPSLEGNESKALAINNNGQTVGSSHLKLQKGEVFSKRAVMWKDNQIYMIGKHEGSINSQALDINDKGQVVGYSFFAPQTDPFNGTNFRSFLYQDGDFEDIGQFFVLSINNHGFAVGDNVLYDSNTKTVYDLNTMICQSGFEVCEALDINDKMEIVGFGRNERKYCGFHLIPVY
jgi:probable HAF family extracellular repeat protein